MIKINAKRGGSIGIEEYRRVLAGCGDSDKVGFLAWLDENDISVRPVFSIKALYHHAPGRQYKPSKREIDSGKFECPACHVILILVTRKAKDPIYRCPGCAWAISRSDIFDPQLGKEPELQPGEYPQGIAPHPSEQEGPW